MPSSQPDLDQPGRHQPGEVTGSGGRGYPGPSGQLARREAAAVHQLGQHGRTGRVTDAVCHRRQVGLVGRGGQGGRFLHGFRLPPPRFAEAQSVVADVGLAAHPTPSDRSSRRTGELGGARIAARRTGGAPRGGGRRMAGRPPPRQPAPPADHPPGTGWGAELIARTPRAGKRGRCGRTSQRRACVAAGRATRRAARPGFVQRPLAPTLPS